MLIVPLPSAAQPSNETRHLQPLTRERGDYATVLTKINGAFAALLTARRLTLTSTTNPQNHHRRASGLTERGDHPHARHARQQDSHTRQDPREQSSIGALASLVQDDVQDAAARFSEGRRNGDSEGGRSDSTRNLEGDHRSAFDGDGESVAGRRATIKHQSYRYGRCRVVSRCAGARAARQAVAVAKSRARSNAHGQIYCCLSHGRIETIGKR